MGAGGFVGGKLRVTGWMAFPWVSSCGSSFQRLPPFMSMSIRCHHIFGLLCLHCSLKPQTCDPGRCVYRDKAAPRADTLKYFLPNPTIYSLLNAGFVAAAALQSYFLYIAPTWGVNVNWDTALWGPLYGTAVLGLVYGLVALARFDWSSALDVALRVACWFAELTMWFWDTFVWKFSWSEKTRRA